MTPAQRPKMFPGIPIARASMTTSGFVLNTNEGKKWFSVHALPDEAYQKYANPRGRDANGNAL